MCIYVSNRTNDLYKHKKGFILNPCIKEGYNIMIVYGHVLWLLRRFS